MSDVWIIYWAYMCPAIRICINQHAKFITNEDNWSVHFRYDTLDSRFIKHDGASKDAVCYQ